jgi:hypothetical protein
MAIAHRRIDVSAECPYSKQEVSVEIKYSYSQQFSNGYPIASAYTPLFST